MWPILGSSITVAIYNGGAPGVIYEFLAAYVVYCMVAASLMELASAIPSSAGVYHWATGMREPRQLERTMKLRRSCSGRGPPVWESRGA